MLHLVPDTLSDCLIVCVPPLLSRIPMTQISLQKSTYNKVVRPKAAELTDIIDDPFAAFSEWASDADEKAYAGLTARRGTECSRQGPQVQ